MLPLSEPKWRRRKDDRPAEIIAAAWSVFAARGLAAARLNDIAKEAGLSKGALYLYFEPKEDLFAAVVAEAIAPQVGDVIAQIAAMDLSFERLARMLVARLAQVAQEQPIGAVMRLVLGESSNFPQLAQVWHERLVAPAIGMVSQAIVRGQLQGELRAGDPRHMAICLVGPMLLGVIWQETFTPIGAEPIDLAALARQHADTLMGGMLIKGDGT